MVTVKILFHAETFQSYKVMCSEVWLLRKRRASMGGGGTPHLLASLREF